MENTYIKLKIKMILQKKWTLKKAILKQLVGHKGMSAQDLSISLNVEVHNVSNCLLRLSQQQLVTGRQERKEEKPRPGHRNRARLVYTIEQKGFIRLQWYDKQDELLKKLAQEVQPKKPKLEVQANKPEEAKTTLERYVKE
jgi:predicted ArsR family transcriptional regulator